MGTVMGTVENSPLARCFGLPMVSTEGACAA
jgi:hypothetical protein